ncbi:tyrosine-type recombinase/integrase [Heyndrickxia acidicola]|uniref:Tyrosine-type recombinase/integrase n=1 Tax=Heyndrickxia acidicola TaxID=209389 RepID=A0ABU6MGB6_9BACI|nr:tyrosine-type recombinase/integrase [Heyndrickxia acidicola]MED1203525.1 tyrosine-type recombinase/integrase [Heyndrickxia acidicola]
MTYKREIEEFAKYLDGSGTNLDGYARSDIQQYINWLAAKGRAASTINKSWHAIKKFSRYHKKYEAIEDIRLVKPKDLTEVAPKALSRVEENRLIREVDRNGNKRDYAIVMTLLHTGLRVSELVSLNRDSIDFSERKGEITVIAKGNKERTVPVSAEARRAIERYLEERPDELNPCNYNNRISVRTVQRILNDYGCHPHILRHTYITKLVREGIDWGIFSSCRGIRVWKW